MTRRDVGLHLRLMGDTFTAARTFVDAVRETVKAAKAGRKRATRQQLKRAAQSVEPLIIAVLELDVALRKAVRRAT